MLIYSIAEHLQMSLLLPNYSAKWQHQFTLTSVVNKSSQFPTSLPVFGTARLFNICQSNGDKVLLMLNLLFPDVEHLCRCLLAILISSFIKYSSCTLSNFCIALSFVINHKSSLLFICSGEHTFVTFMYFKYISLM